MSARPSALVTGASSGIGAALTRRLAASGHDVVVVARDGGRLERLAADLKQAHDGRVEVLAADLADPAELARVAARIGEGDPLDIVVNNAGFGAYGRFDQLPLGGQTGQVQLNVLALVVLSHAALAVMAARGSGGLLNVSSTAGFQPGPGSATYSATKAFVTSFTEALHEEMRTVGVRVTALCPGFTRTEFHQRADVDVRRLPAFVWADADQVAATGLAALARNQAVCVPGALNRLTGAATRFGPRPLVRRVSASVLRRL